MDAVDVGSSSELRPFSLDFDAVGDGKITVTEVGRSMGSLLLDCSPPTCLLASCEVSASGSLATRGAILAPLDGLRDPNVPDIAWLEPARGGPCDGTSEPDGDASPDGIASNEEPIGASGCV